MLGTARHGMARHGKDAAGQSPAATIHQIIPTLGMAWHGGAEHGLARYGTVWQGTAWQGEARMPPGNPRRQLSSEKLPYKHNRTQGKAWQLKAAQGWEWQGTARQGYITAYMAYHIYGLPSITKPKPATQPLAEWPAALMPSAGDSGRVAPRAVASLANGWRLR